MTASEELEARFLVSEYEQLLEEIREAGRSSWAPWTAYLAASAYLLGTLRSIDPLAILASLAMVGLGLLVVLYVYKLRRQNNLNYARIWEIEGRLRTIAQSEVVGARWNPWAWPRLQRTLGYEHSFLGVVDFWLIIVTLLLADAWLVFGVAGLLRTDLNTLDLRSWAVVAASAIAVLVLGVRWWRREATSERSAHDRWRSQHPQH